MTMSSRIVFSAGTTLPALQRFECLRDVELEVEALLDASLRHRPRHVAMAAVLRTRGSRLQAVWIGAPVTEERR